MRDTHPKIKERFHQMMMSRSGEERFLMSCSMFDAAERERILAWIREGNSMSKLPV